jgi:hypothetical protein
MHDHNLVAVDLTACDESIPSFMFCRRLTFARFPTSLRELPAGAFAGCSSLAAAALSPCTELSSIGDVAFAGTRSMKVVSIPGSLKHVGRLAFLGSGIARFDASQCDVTMGDESMACCNDLMSARFGVARCSSVFFGCRLRELAVSRIDKVDRLALLGLSVEPTALAPHDAFKLASDVLIPPGQESVIRTWSAVERPELVAMTNLRVTGGELALAEAQRVLVSEIDLSTLRDLPGHLTLRCCYFLERVLLPSRLGRVPDHLFYRCVRLCHVNLEECHALHEIGDSAFQAGWSLERVALPGSCVHIDFRGSGITDLDVLSNHVEVVDIRTCARLKTLRLPRDFSGDLRADAFVALSSLTLGWGGLGGTGPACLHHREVRYMSARGVEGADLAVEASLSSVCGEVMSFSSRASRPLLPA